MLRFTCAVALSLVVAGCDHGRTKAVEVMLPAATELKADTRDLWVRYRDVKYAEVPPAEYPPSVKRLEPTRVSVDPKGVMIETHSVFVESAGIFVRFDPSYEPPRSGDPGFEPVAEDIFWYYAPG